MSAKKRPAKFAQTWCVLSLLHNKIESHIEKALQNKHQLSTKEFSTLSLLEEQPDQTMRMNDLAERLVLSNSATTRLINRLEDRGLLKRKLCDDDRRGILSEVTGSGRALLVQARPTNDAALEEALQDAEKSQELAPFVGAIRSFNI